MITWNFAEKIAEISARCHMLILKKDHDDMKRAIQTVFGDNIPEDKIKRIAARNNALRYKIAVHRFFYRNVTRENIRTIIPHLDGEVSLSDALSMQRGVIMVTLHYGLYEHLVGGLAYRGYPINFLYYDELSSATFMKRPAIKLKSALWHKSLVKNVSYRPGMYVRRIFRILGNNEILLVFIDGLRGNDFLSVPFHNTILLLAKGPFRLAAKTGSPIVPAVILGDSPANLKIVVKEPIVVQSEVETDMSLAAAQTMEEFSSFIDQYPENWFSWGRLRFDAKGNVHNTMSTNRTHRTRIVTEIKT